jgi:tetratricopeptide (TPR) repeat protein
MDVEDIQPGENFAQTIERTLGKCSHVLAVIGPHWREILEARAKQQDEDYVVHELATALKQKKTVVPVFVAGATPASLTALPPELADLSFHQAVELHDSSFNDDCDRMAKTLHLTREWSKKPLLWLVAGAAILGLLALAAANVGFGPWHGAHERKLQVTGLLKTAHTQIERADYQTAFQSYQQALNLAPKNGSALDGQVDASMLWLENFHAIAPEGQKAEDIAASILPQIGTVLDAGLARTSGKDARAADIVAHLGWLHWLNEKIAHREFGNAERCFAQALGIEPSNVYAHAFLGNWLLQTNGDSAAAIKHFQIALAASSHRELVRRMQLGGLFENDAPGMRVEFIKALNQVRLNHEPLDKDLRDRTSYLYSPTVNDARELHDALTAVPPDEAWQTFLWLNPERPGESDSALRDFIHASLAEISGKRAAALEEFRSVSNLLKTMHANGRIADYTTDAIRRLTH